MGTCPKTQKKNLISTKWVFRNKLNEDGQVIRNKVSLMRKRYAQVEGIDFEETFVPVARIKKIKMFLDYACSKNIKVYQKVVKSIL